MSTTVKTWKEWLDEFPDGQIITNDDVREAMLKEIDDLRVALAYLQESVKYMLKKTGYMDVEVLVDELVKVKQESKDEITRLEKENGTLQAQLQELNLRYISDFGQLQEQEPIGKIVFADLGLHLEVEHVGNSKWEEGMLVYAAVDASKAWGEGYKQGILDERTSESNIGIAGFGAKVNPARQNPYNTKE